MRTDATLTPSLAPSDVSLSENVLQNVPVGPWVEDGVVHRTAGPWSLAVQQLLGYLGEAGFA